MAERQQRLACDLEVSMRHADGGLFITAGQKFGLLVAAVIDQRLVQGAETRGWIAGQIFYVERFDHVDHEVGTGLAVIAFDLLRRSGFCGGNLRGRTQRRWTWAGSGSRRIRRTRSLRSA